MYVYVRVHVCTCVYVCTCARVYVCVYVYVCTCVCVLSSALPTCIPVAPRSDLRSKVRHAKLELKKSKRKNYYKILGVAKVRLPQ